MLFRDGVESIVAICRDAIRCADDAAAEIALGSRSEAKQRSLVVCIEGAGDVGRD